MTIEGVAQGDALHPLQQKFLEHAALQCGICTPGFIVAAKALLDRQSRSDRRGSAVLAGRESVPVHRLRQDRPRGARTPRPTCERRRYERASTSTTSARGRSGTTVSTRSRAAPTTAPTSRCRHAPRRRAAQSARARAHRVDRHERGRSRARRQGGRHRHRTFRETDAKLMLGEGGHRPARHRRQPDGARQSALSRPRGGRGRGHHARDRARAAAAIDVVYDVLEPVMSSIGRSRRTRRSCTRSW